MIERLLERLERRTTFVVGKGGVGKTTTAGGLALARAAAGSRTHLVSTDPAHSLFDLFDLDAGASARIDVCGLPLTVEEPDAAEVARLRLSGLEPALRELLDRGTYLDDEDATALLRGTLPGLDEIGAALRIAEIRAGLGPAEALVVDTAPTGHTLRLLDLHDTLAGWLDVFRAMGEKVDAVASALVRRSVHLTATDAVDALEEELRAFRDAARDADFVVVTGPGAVVRAETERLTRGLEARGLHVAATVAVAGGGAAADLELPLRTGLRGCEALRAWLRPGPESRPGPPPRGVDDGDGGDGEDGEDGGDGEDGEDGGARAAAAVRPAGPAADVLAVLDRELVVFAGKGGVGKTTCAAAAAVVLAGRGAVRLVGADPASSLGDVLPEGAAGVAVVDADAGTELEAFRGRYREEVEAAFEAVGLDGSARLDRAVVERLWELAPPGLDELIAVARLADEGAPDTRLVLDTAPTGHFLRLVAMPELALDWVRRIMRILLKYRAVGGLDAPAEPLIRFARRLKALHERLSDPSRTAIVLVTLDEPLVRTETVRLAERLRALGLPVAATVMNRSAMIPPDDAARLPAPLLLAPRVAEPIGEASLRAFAAEWRRAS